MIRKRVLIIITLLPFIMGYFLASNYSKKPQVHSHTASYDIQNIPANDTITLSITGNIYQLSQNGVRQITNNQDIIEPSKLDNGYIAITKQTNYSSLLKYDQSGNLTQTLFNGNTGNIDSMRWISDPSVNPKMDKIAYVSDQNKHTTNIPDNSLFIMDLQSGTTINIAQPDPYSGGLTHPVWDPSNPMKLYYDYYQYDNKSLNPYSTVMEYDANTGISLPITTDKQNAFQESISPDGKNIIFLLRTEDDLQVMVELGDISQNAVTNLYTLATGDYAYPEFSNSTGHIYFLQSSANSGYDLYTAQIKQNKLENILPVTNGQVLLGNSSYEVTKD